jgi:hypothetical protein
MAYCIIYSGESICCDEFIKLSVTPVFKFTNIDQHKQAFYESMVKIFSQYEDTFVPKSVNEIDVEYTDKFVLEFQDNKYLLSYKNTENISDVYQRKFTHEDIKISFDIRKNKDIKNNESRFAIISYGTSGGLSLSFMTILGRFC